MKIKRLNHCVSILALAKQLAHPKDLLRKAVWRWLNLPLWGRALYIFCAVTLTALAIIAPWAHATSQGPNSASASSNCVDDGTSSGAGTVTWTNPGNAFSQNTTYATASVDGTTTHYIDCTNFGFTIPSGSTINGVVVEVNRKSSSTSNGGSQDAAVRLIKGGAVGATDRSTATVYTTADTYESHGGTTDLWGTTLTVSDVNASNFGAAFAAKKASAAGAAQTVSVDHIRITVYYTAPVYSLNQYSYRLYGNSDASGSITFAKAWGGSGYDYGNSVAKTSDGGYAVTGYNASFGAGGNDMFIARYDSGGNLSWSKTWGGTGDDEGNSIVQTSDGGYAVTGFTTSFGAGGNDMFIAKYNSSGTLSWSKTWGSTGSEQGNSIVQTSDGGYAVTGYTNSFGAGGNDLFLAKYDSSGNLSWNKTWGGTSSDYAEYLVQTSDGGYAVTGYTLSFGTGQDMFIVKFDSSGNLSWNSNWGGTSSEYSYSLVQTSDGGYAITGKTTSYGDTFNGDMFLVKYDSLGNLSWSRTWGGGGTNVDQGYSVIQTSDGGYAVTGTTGSFGAGLNDMFLVKYDSSGNLSWNRTFGGTDNDQGNSVVQTSDGGYAVTGYGGSFGAGLYDMFLAKFDGSGNMSNCSSPTCQTPTATTTSPTVTTGNPTATTGSPTATTGSPTATTGSPAATSTTIITTGPAIDVGSPLAAANTAATVTDGTPFRLRFDIAVTGAQLNSNTGSFKLRYAPMNTSCPLTPIANFVDVTTSTTVRYYDNTNAVNGESVAVNANDPTRSGTATVTQTYQESGASTFFNPNAIPAGQDGLWDFALNTYHTLAGASYCLMMVKSDGSSLDTVTSLAQINLPSSPTYNQAGYRWFSNSNSGFSTFAENYGFTTSDDIGEHVIQTSDGGYATAGYSSGVGAGSNDALISKFNSDGTLAWSRTFGGVNSDIAYSIIQTSDGGYAVTGNTVSFGAGPTSGDAFIAKLTSNGSLSWSRTFGGNNSDSAYSIIQTSDGGYAVAGGQSSFSDTTNGDAFIAKFTSNGSLTWARTWGGAGAIDTARSIIQTSDGGYAISGETATFGAGLADAFMAKFTSNGSLSWSRTWGGTGSETCYSIVQSSDGGYAISGYTNSFGSGGYDAYLVKFTSSGNLSWARTWGGPTNNDYSYSLAKTSDNGFVITGSTTSFAVLSQSAYIAKFDSSGNLSWSHIFGNGQDSYNGYSVFQTSDSGYVVAGYDMDWKTSINNILLLKYDSNGNMSGCGTDCESDTAGGGLDYTSSSYWDTNGTTGTPSSGTFTSTDKWDTNGSTGTPNNGTYTSTNFWDTNGTTGTPSSGTFTSANFWDTNGTTGTPSSGTYTSTNDWDTTGTSGTPNNGTFTNSLNVIITASTGALIGPPLPGPNQVGDLESLGQPFRLRLLIGLSGTGIASGSPSFKLQYAIRSGACSSSTYSDITTTSTIRWYDNSALTTGASIVAASGDPTDGSNTVVPQTYQEANNFTGNSALYASQDGEWDFALMVPTGVIPGTDVCIRAVPSASGSLDTYSYYPEIQYGPTMDQRMRTGKWFDRNGAAQPYFLLDKR